MVHITMEGEASPGALVMAHEGSSPRDLKYSGNGAVVYRSDSRMSLEGTSEEEDSGFRDRSHSDTKTSSSDVSFPSASPKSEGFSSSPNSLSHDDARTSPRARAVLDLSMTSPFKKRGKKDHQARRGSFSHALVPPYSPLSSNASMSSSSSSSPSVSPSQAIHAHPPSHHGRPLEEVSIHDIAKEVVDRRSLHGGPSTSYHSPRSAPIPPTATAAHAGSAFDLPKNFYGYYVYQLELASRASHRQQGLNNLASNPQSPRSTPPLSSTGTKAGNSRNDDETVSYGSLLEQALRNGLKRSPSEVPSTPQADKRLKSSSTATPPPPSVGHAGRQPSSTSQQISVEDVAKTSLRELLHSKQMQEAKAHQQHMSAFANATGSNSRGTSRSSSPSVNLKTLLETQSREASKGPASSSAMGFTPVYPKYGQSPMAGGGRYNASVPTGQAPLIYPHVFNRSSSPPAQSARGPEGASTSSMFLSSFQSQMPAGAANGGGSGSFKHKKLLEWSANDVRDWVSTLSYCSEFADAFVQQSVDGVALTLLNETHLMKNFQMKLGPAIKLRCAIWEILGLCQTAQMPMPLGPMPQFLSQKQLPMAFPLPQHHASISKQ